MFKAIQPTLRALRLCFAAMRNRSLLLVVLVSAEAAAGLAALYTLKRLVDAVSDGSSEQAMAAVVLATAAALSFVALRAFSALATELYAQEVADQISDRINARSVAADFAFYESPRYHDLLARALFSGGTRPARVISNLIQTAQALLLLTAMGSLLVAVHWLLLPILLASLVPALAIRFYFARRFHRWQKLRISMERRASYLQWLITDKGHAKEVRAYGLGDFLRATFNQTRTTLRLEKAKISWRRTVLDLLVAAAATAAFFLSIALMVQQARSGQISFGDLAMFLIVFQRGQAMLQSLKTNVANLFEDNLYLRDFFEFEDQRNELVEPPDPRMVAPALGAGLSLQKVSFRYPRSELDALSEIDMTIEPGQIVALVGANGSGKTTLIKLLLRLYDPSQGQISLDDHSLPEYGLADYRRAISVVFQDYANYHVSAGENIRYGDVQVPPGDPRIAAAAAQTGADELIRGLPQGYDTLLGRVLDEGAELSVGQWQKIALARALLGDSKFVVLDEPTSALDPGAEFELFKDFRGLLNGRGALVISHRLSTVRMADRIYVLDQGRIVEQGSHEQLITAGGHYCDLFQKQAFHYRH